MDVPPPGTDLRRLHEEEVCGVCMGKFYGTDKVGYYLGCYRPHFCHAKCIARGNFKLRTKEYMCFTCRQSRGYDQLRTFNMPYDLPQRLLGGDSPPEGHPAPPPLPAPSPPPPPPPPPSPPLPPAILEADVIPPFQTQLLSDDDGDFIAPDGPIPSDLGQTFCIQCGLYLKPGHWTRVNGRVLCIRCTAKNAGLLVVQSDTDDEEEEDN